jgi:hypothetical protein
MHVRGILPAPRNGRVPIDQFRVGLIRRTLRAVACRDLCISGGIGRHCHAAD